MSQKLELTRIGKNKQYKLEPRVLVENPELSYGDPKSENMLIHGDNLLALKALEQEYAGKVKCIYIDPPYNTGNAFEHYDDGLEHSEWLSLMKPRLILLRNLLSEDGSIWISIDDYESHYLKVLCDEIFGRKNFVANIVWEKTYTPKSNGRGVSSDHDHVLVFAKSPTWFDSGWNLLPRNEEQKGRFSNTDNDPNGPWRTYPLDVRTEDEERRAKYKYEVVTPSGRIVKPAKGRHWALPKEVFERQRNEGLIYFGKDGSAKPSRKVYLKDAKKGILARSWWTYKDAGSNQDAKREVRELNSSDIFSTPKPEKLIQRIMTIATNDGDLVLDSFLGSGTTTGVAHKMGRRRIGIEMGDHAYTHCKLRMDKVIDGNDGLKLSEELGWEGGGGYKFYELGPSLLARDKYGNYVINPAVNGLLLIQALCKVENFTYKAFDGGFKHGYSTEKDFIHVTTRHITQDIIEDIQETHLIPGETLLIMCKTFAPDLDLPDHIQVKKIPLEVMDKCEYGDDINYSLPVLSDNEESND